MQFPRGKLHVGFIALILTVFLMMGAPLVSAQQVPPFGGDVYIQTSGPNAGIGIGDYYTSNAGEPNAANRLHRVEFNVPCTWPANTPITISAFDPESSGLPSNEDVAAGLPATRDEMRGPAFDNTVFTVRAPDGTVIGPRTFTPAGGTDLLWVELITFRPNQAGYGCGTYIVESATADDDDNSWTLRVGHDPDCTDTPGTCSTVGAASSALMGNGNFSADADGVDGTGDELFIGFTRITFQHNSNSCQNIYFYVDRTLIGQTINLNNFDFDDPGGANGLISISYTQPDGTTSVGTESGGSVWNVSNAITRGGDPFVVTEPMVGWWEADICMTVDNQYIFEGLEDRPIFFVEPLEPLMIVAKDDGRTEVSSSGEEVVYVITYENIGRGAAANVEINDTLPTGATFVSCSNGCTNTGTTATWNLPLVRAGEQGEVRLRVLLPPAPDGSTHTNVVTLDYTDLLGNNYLQVMDDDIDLVRDNPATATFTPIFNPFPPGTPGAPSQSQQYISKSANPPFAAPGEIVTWTISLTNPGPNPLTNVRVVDTLPSQLELLSASASIGTATISGQTVTFTAPGLAVGASAQVTVRSRVRGSVQPPYLLENNACLTSTEITSAICTKATVSSATGLPSTGESALSPWRTPLFLGAGLLMMSAFALFKRPARR